MKRNIYRSRAWVRRVKVNRAPSVIAAALLALCLLSFGSRGDTPPEAPYTEREDVKATYLVTVPLVGMLLKDLLGADVEVNVVSDALDYHAPQVTPRQLQAWQEVTHVIWFGEEIEPQMAGVIRKVATGSHVQMITLPVKPEEKGSHQEQADHEPVKNTDESTRSRLKHEHPHSIHKDIHRPTHKPVHSSSAGSSRLEHHKGHDKHKHKHHEDASYAHPWLSTGRVKIWANLIVETTHALPNQDSKKLSERFEHWLKAFDLMSSHWRVKLHKIENRSFVQAHAAFEPLAHDFDLKPIGALTTHHDTAIGLKELFALRKQVRAHNTRCFIAMQDSKRSIPPNLFPTEPRLYVLDPLGQGYTAKPGSDQPISVSFFSGLLSDFYRCLAGAAAEST